LPFKGLLIPGGILTPYPCPERSTGASWQGRTIKKKHLDNLPSASFLFFR